LRVDRETFSSHVGSVYDNDILINDIANKAYDVGWNRTSHKCRQVFYSFYPHTLYNQAVPLDYCAFSGNGPLPLGLGSYIDGKGKAIIEKQSSTWVPPLGWTWDDIEMLDSYHPSQLIVLRTIAGIINSKYPGYGGTFINREWTSAGTYPNTIYYMELVYPFIGNTVLNWGMGVSLQCRAMPSGWGGYSLSSQIPTGSNTKSHFYIGTPPAATLSQQGEIKVAFAKDDSEIYNTSYTEPIQKDSFADQYSNFYGRFYGNLYTNYMYVTPYALVVIPDGVKWQSIHAGALMKDAAYGICGYSFKYNMKTQGVLTYAYKDEIATRNKTLRILCLRYKSLGYINDSVKWISGEAQMSDVFITLEEGQWINPTHTMLGRLLNSFETYNKVDAPQTIEYHAGITLYPVTQSVPESFDQTIGTLVL